VLNFAQVKVSAAKRAFSLIELLTVISIIGILASLLLMALAGAQRKSRQVACLNNLHQIGLGFTTFALDHEGKYQMDVPERLGGSLEYNQSLVIENTPFSRDYHHFWVLSNEIPNVKILVCPADHGRRTAFNYQTFTNDNLSYWANTKAVPHATLSTLAGDWNVHNTGATSNDFQQLNFSREVHQRRGSVLFADGRVEITRTLAVATPTLTDPITVATPPTTTQPPRTAGVPGARPQPTSATPPAAVPVTSPSSQPQPGANNTPTPANRQKTIAERPRLETNEVASVTSSSEMQAGSRRIPRSGRIGSGSEADPPKVGETQPIILNTTAGPARANEEEEPWDTPGFRLFKSLAFLSYLISLLWALVALLLLYLKSRLAQREEEERAASIHVD
jgi:prepilin-type N-terminal cleavage/methylation domain-containing protein/prepilin-type processing-associated H-X9-DG protein